MATDVRINVLTVATYPGANPKVLADTVASPLEEQINGVEGMLSRTSRRSGMYWIAIFCSFR